MADIGTEGFSRTKRFDQAERLKRIHDAKNRAIGVDTQFLQAQVADKNDATKYENDRDIYYEQIANYFDQKLVMAEQERREIKDQMAKELVAYRNEFQQKEGTLEFDLNDPMLLKTSKPARVGDDTVMPVSSLQMFDGEDLSAGERKKLQTAQQAAWCAAQAAEKGAKKAAEVDAEAEYTALLRAQEDVQHEVYGHLDKARAQMRLSTAAANKALAAEKAGNKEAYAAAIAEADQAEANYILTSDTITENTDTSISAMAPWRVRTDHWKGMSGEQVGDVLAMQAMQRSDMQARRRAEKASDMAYAGQQEAIRRTLEIKAAQVEGFKAEQRQAVAKTLNAQKAEKAERDATLASVYTNVPTKDFFGQFGTSAR